MPMFRVTIHQLVKETSHVTVEAENQDEASERAGRMWENGEITDWDTGDVDPYHSPDIDKVELLEENKT